MKATHYRTLERTGERWAEKAAVQFKPHYKVQQSMIAVNSKEKYQSHIGFGGAFTEAAASTFHEMPEALQEEFIKAYFNKEQGLGYVLGRVAIHSCDFALGNYTYIEEGDSELKSFDLSHEEQWVIPMIKRAAEQAGQPITMLASPWSPPAFMKSNGEMNYGGKLLAEYQQSWASYYTKFIEQMELRGVPIWGISIQNEPEADQIWDSCFYSAEEERDFIKNYLGPTMYAAGYQDKAIVIWDHNRDVMVQRTAIVLSDPEAAKYVWGVGNHWYVSEDFDNLSMVHHLYPDTHLIFTEGCVELTDTSVDKNDKSGYLGAWGNGERYGRNIIGDFNNYSEGWIDWNLLLNEQGGPNHVENYCEAPIMYNRQTKSLIYNNSYYYIGHLSRYVEIGAKRIKTQVIGENLHAVSFENSNGERVVVVQNEGHVAKLTLVVDGLGAELSLANNSISTFVLKA
ncbi:glycoside hydrolase family 30 beta sandwich domain-containing protein [Agarivorans sp. Alg241-V36]|uniref:glycoside hydrolase family 30 protein n=1 Tax=Agarivorans sp. Alg241-V36 TaxID=2305992 RepID=UPI0013D4A5C3|nr:glycoside hydrolase family 30 protein [Agarivorans sp. Alg241-V36]